jgi:hypothetical protein
MPSTDYNTTYSRLYIHVRTVHYSYDAFSKSRGENTIIYIGNVVEFRSIAKRIGTKTYIRKDDLTKISTIADYRSRTKHINGFSV